MLSKKETVKYLVIFLLLLPIFMLLLSNTLDLLQDSPPMSIDNASEVILYYLRPTQGGIAQFFNFLWMLWPGLFLYLWKQKKISLQQHLLYQAYPFVLFFVYYGLELVAQKGLTPFYYLPLPLAMKTFFLGLFTGYPLAPLLYVYLWMMSGIKTDPSSRKVMTTQARHILLFCAAMCLLLFLTSYGMGVYSTGIIRQAQVNSVELRREWGDW